MMLCGIVLVSALATTGHAFEVGACDDQDATSKTCCDVTVANNPTCHTALNWAKTQGYPAHQKWYGIYGVNASSSDADFQCALFWMSWDEVHQKNHPEKADHQCPRPCSSLLLHHCAHPPYVVAPVFNGAYQQSQNAPNSTFVPQFCSTATFVGVLAPNCTCGDNVTQTTMENESCVRRTAYANATCEDIICDVRSCKTDCSSSSISPLIIALIVLLALALIAALAYFLFMGRKDPKKKKRAIKKTRAAPPAEPTPPPVEAPPASSFTMVPLQTTAMPMVQYAAPQYHFAPQQQVVRPQTIQYAAPQPQMVRYAGQ